MHEGKRKLFHFIKGKPKSFIDHFITDRVDKDYNEANAFL